MVTFWLRRYIFASCIDRETVTRVTHRDVFNCSVGDTALSSFGASSFQLIFLNITGVEDALSPEVAQSNRLAGVLSGLANILNPNGTVVLALGGMQYDFNYLQGENPGRNVLMWETVDLVCIPFSTDSFLWSAECVIEERSPSIPNVRYFTRRVTPGCHVMQGCSRRSP